MTKSGLKVFAPASIANLSVGYDILGLALEMPGDEIIVREGKEKGLVISKITGDNGKLPRDIYKNTAGYAGFRLLQQLGREEEPIAMEIRKKMPFNSGLGSSAASAAAAVMAINEYLNKPLSKRELLPFAVYGEQVADGAFHADNVAPSLMGGIILIRNNQEFDFIRLPSPPGLFVAVIHPHIHVPTKESRAILRKQVKLTNHIRQSGNLGAFVAALFTSDIDLMRRSLHDLIIEPQRKHFIPYFDEMKQFAINRQTICFGISGAGPSVFSICENSLQAENLVSDIGSFLKERKLSFDSYISKINQQGAFKY